MARLFQENPKLERIRNRIFNVFEYHWLRPVRFTEDFDGEIMKRVIDAGPQNEGQKNLLKRIIGKKKSLKNIETNDWKKVIGSEDTGKLRRKENMILYSFFFVHYIHNINAMVKRFCEI